MRNARSCALMLILFFPALHAQGQALPGTKLWEDKRDPAAAMVQGINRYFDRELAASVAKRQRYWKCDFSSPEAYRKSNAANRDRLIEIIGAKGRRASPVELIYIHSYPDPALMPDSSKSRVRQVRWTVYPGFEAEGLIVEPHRSSPMANVVYIPDAEQTPEDALGLTKTMPDPLGTSVPRLLAGLGFRVLIPTLVNRGGELSRRPTSRPSGLNHREWIYRMAYEGGKHLIGYEVDEVRAALDWFKRDDQTPLPTGVAGYGEGGLIALFAAAVDPRIDAVWIRGFFAPREDVWKEPIDRNVWGLLERFGDAELGALVAPRPLVIEALKVPTLAGSIPGPGAPVSPTSGRLETPAVALVEKETARARVFYDRLGKGTDLTFARSMDDSGKVDLDEFEKAKSAFFLGLTGLKVLPSAAVPDLLGPGKTDSQGRQKRIVDQLTEQTQQHLRTSELRRYAYWSKADTSSLEKYSASTQDYRERFWSGVIGKLPPASESLSAETRQIFDEPKWKGYAVRMPVYPDVFASGVLLLPKDLKEGERRPVVVCQHGLEGKPDPVVDPKIKSVYNSFGAQLADRGYIVYAPQNPYIGEDGFRVIMRKANPLGMNLFSVIVRQHERTLEWLKTLANVDPAKIAFYGLSYGGKTAMRVPAIVEGYCLSICSADFNEWVVKCTNIDRNYSYLYTIEYDMYEFGLSEGFNYAEMAALIAPRPFMVERGHQDGVAPDEWIGYEFAKIRRLYDTLGISERAAITYFNGGHMIKGDETFKFLDQHLGWKPR